MTNLSNKPNKKESKSSKKSYGYDPESAGHNKDKSEKKKAIALTQNPLFIEAKKLRMKKRFSQNMLVSQSVIDHIVSVVEPKSGNTIVEIGPGMGFLTRQFLESDADNVVAIELERQMLRHLNANYGSHSKLLLIEHDVLKFNFETIEAAKFKVVGNLPYNITTPILFYLCGELDVTHHPLRSRLRNLTLMVQKEVGQRVTASPGEKGYNALSVAIQNWFTAEYLFTVPADSFHPAPKVQSAVIQLTPRANSVIPEAYLKSVKKLVQTGFHQKRKILKNGWQGLMPKDQLDEFFKIAEAQGLAGISASRAEQLSLEQFGQLAKIYDELSQTNA